MAALYGVPTFRFDEAIKRNKNRFPPDFMFQLSQAEFEALRSQTAISEMEGAGQLIANCDEFKEASRHGLSPLRLHRTRRSPGGEYSQEPARRAAWGKFAA